MYLNVAILVICGFLHHASAEYFDYPEVRRGYKFFPDIKTWYDARIACKVDGAELAMPMNDKEAEIIRDIFNQHTMASIKGHYPNRTLLNFHDLFEQGEFVLDSGDNVQYAYHKWAKGEPKMDNERCGSMDRYGLIDDFPCEEKTSYICQKGTGLDIEGPDLKCSPYDTAYQEFKGKCYKYHIEPRTWYDARAICHAEGGFLAIIMNKIEEDYLLELMNKPENQVTYVQQKCCALIGIHDRFKEGKFMTLSGAPLENLEYVHWHKGQPDNARGKEDCGSLHREGGLNDVYCDVPLPFICEHSINALDDRMEKDF